MLRWASPAQTAAKRPEARYNVTAVLNIDPDIRRALLPPADFYRKSEPYEALIERVFARSWQVDLAPELEGVAPFEWLAGSVGESLLWTRSESGELSCLSNVCTHRGARLCEKASTTKSLRCRYHGRRFDLQGQLLSAPGFEDAEDFPRKRDHLAQAQVGQWGPLRFAALDPERAFASIAKQLDTYFGFLSPREWTWDEAGSRSFSIAANGIPVALARVRATSAS